jgi:hypothetical protein
MGVISAKSQFCATLLDSESSGIGCKGDSEFTGDFEFKAYQSGITLNSFNPDNNFQWTCKEGDIKVGERVTCNYPDAGSFTPKLKVYDEASQKWIDTCANQTTVKVTTQSSCGVLARKASTGDKEEFSKSVSINQGDTAEAKINRQCLTGGEVKWTVTGGTKTFEEGDNVTVSPSGTSSVRISAQIVKDGKTSNCGSADVDVTETVKWR